MARIYRSLVELTGNTPLLEVCNIERDERLEARLLVKIESFNPGGSAKDRVALSMIEAAERSGKLRPGGTIIEPTSGNTGIGLAWVASVKGYKLVLTMPDTMSSERRRLLKALGATLVLTPGAEGMRGAISRAEELCAATHGAIILGQFDNPANPDAHMRTTGPEIWADTDGAVDVFVAGVGTGGTVSGVGRALKQLKPSVRVVAVEPAASPVLEGGIPGPHGLQGIGAGFIPRNYSAAVVDEVVAVTEADAMRGARMLARKEGLLAGISSGAAFEAALREALKPENKGKTIVVLLPDTGERYLSTALFESV
ncbi:MAG: cysteine synthase A [Muribaculaceae bacterium]|nr:cysteine synthase A [Muribaculaceae bacterium]